MQCVRLKEKRDDGRGREEGSKQEEERRGVTGEKDEKCWKYSRMSVKKGWKRDNGMMLVVVVTAFPHPDPFIEV